MNAIWEVAGKVVIAIAALTNTIGTTDDDVALQRVAGTISTIGIAGTDDSAGGVNGELRAGDRGRGNEEGSSVLHFCFLLFKSRSKSECLFRCWSYARANVFVVL